MTSVVSFHSAPFQSIFHPERSSQSTNQSIWFNCLKVTPLHLNNIYTALSSFPTSLCAVLPLVSTAASMLAFFCVLMRVTLGLPHMLGPPPGVLSPTSFHPVSLGLSSLPEHLSSSHPLKFGFPITVSPCVILYGTCDFELRMYSCAYFFYCLVPLLDWKCPEGTNPLRLFCPLLYPHLNPACDPQWVLSKYLLDEWLFTSHFLGQTACRKEYFTTQRNECLWSTKSNLECLYKWQEAFRWWFLGAWSTGKCVRHCWLEMKLGGVIISIPYLS